MADFNILDVMSLFAQDPASGISVQNDRIISPSVAFNKGDNKEIAKPGVKVEFKSSLPISDLSGPVKSSVNDIWTDEDLQQGAVIIDDNDGRQIAEYDILYRQKVSAEDMFLGLSDVDPSSDHCQEITVKIQVPGTTMRNISLDVTDERLLMQAPKHKLNIALPYAVDADRGSAKFDPKSCILSIILPIRCNIEYVDIRSLNEARSSKSLN